MKKIIIFGVFVSLVFAVCERNNSKDIVICDNKIWQDNEEVKENKMPWEDAAKYCKNLRLAGYNTWRVPNIEELESIVDNTRMEPALIKTFKNQYSKVWKQSYYWSSTTCARNDKKAWFIGFKMGGNAIAPKKAKRFVRCISD